MTRVISLALGFATGFLAALTGAWWTMEVIVRMVLLRERAKR